MDARLAELYGTNQPDEADLEKLAAAEFADGLAEDGEIDLDNVDEETLEQLAQEVLEEDEGEEAEEGEEEGQEKTAKGEEAEEGEEEPSQEEQEKVAEADHLGRVMAHAYVQELRGIEKEAAGGAKAFFKGVLKKGKGAAESAGRAFRRGKKAVKGYHAAAKTEAKQAITGKRHVRSGADIGDAAKMEKKERWKSGGKAAARFLPHAAAAGTVEEGARRKFKKAASATPALDALAAKRAQEILAENGIEVAGEEPKQEAPPAAYDALAGAVEERAMKMLEAEGYKFEEDEKE